MSLTPRLEPQAVSRRAGSVDYSDGKKVTFNLPRNRDVHVILIEWEPGVLNAGTYDATDRACMRINPLFTSERTLKV